MSLVFAALAPTLASLMSDFTPAHSGLGPLRRADPVWSSGTDFCLPALMSDFTPAEARVPPASRADPVRSSGTQRQGAACLSWYSGVPPLPCEAGGAVCMFVVPCTRLPRIFAVSAS